MWIMKAETRDKFVAEPSAHNEGPRGLKKFPKLVKYETREEAASQGKGVKEK